MTVLSAIRTSFSRSTEALLSPRAEEKAALSPPAQPAILEATAESSESTTSVQPPEQARSSEQSSTASADKPDKSVNPPRRWSIQNLVKYPRKATQDVPHTIEELDKREQAAAQAAEHVAHAPKLTSSDRRALHHANVVRALIIGPEGITPAPSKAAISKSDVNKTKAALLQPKEANKVIARLRDLPPAESSTSIAPIHAVCLSLPEAEADKQHFQRLKSDTTPPTVQLVRTRDINAEPPAPPILNVATATLESVSDAFRDLNLVSLVTTPDFGLGGPADGPGILSGALPSAEAVVNGIVQITPQLMSLGYATGKAIVPNHTGVYPPKDRMSVLTYWWGLEVVMPEPTMSYLGQAQSISHTVMNFLTALAAINNGVRELLPFVRYISQFMEWEFSAIKAQDKGKGVVCAATWVMPAAMVPRPWDFQSPPPPAPAPAVPELEPPVDAPKVEEPAPSTPPVEQKPSSGPVEEEPPSSNIPEQPAKTPEVPAASPSDKTSSPAESVPISPIALFPGAVAVNNA
ncbi:unnamed protein product [Peniophora sp. CBMAI 1063]|nr:unnamed protein product [Peniophora sp. CBMAI 1063]